MKNKLGTNLRKRVVMFAIAGAMALTGVAGMTGTAKAEDPETYPNYLDTDYSFKSVSSVGYTECRKKTDTTKVYAAQRVLSADQLCEAGRADF